MVMSHRRLLSSAVTLACALVLICVAPTQGSRQKLIFVGLRYDDCRAQSFQDDARVIMLLREHGLSCTFGIIPIAFSGSADDASPQPLVSLTPVAIRMLRDAIAEGTVDPALHGLSHQTVPGADRLGGPREFTDGSSTPEMERYFSRRRREEW